MLKPLSSVGLSLIMAMALSACQASERGSAGRSGQVVVSGEADIGGAFNLVNQDGKAVTPDDYLGKPFMTYFGFSFCPDVCPTALAELGAVQARVDPEGTQLNYLFISVDPERDTPESLKTYVTAAPFPKNLQGLTGSVEQVEAAKLAYKIYAAKVDDPQSTGGYTVDHVSLIYLFDKAGKFVDVFSHRDTVPEISGRVRQHLKTDA